LAKIVERLHESVTAISECKELGPTGRERPNSHPQLPAIRTSEFHPKEVEEIPSPPTARTADNLVTQQQPTGAFAGATEITFQQLDGA